MIPKTDKRGKLIHCDTCVEHEPAAVSDCGIPVMVKCRTSGLIVAAGSYCHLGEDK